MKKRMLLLVPAWFMPLMSEDIFSKVCVKEILLHSIEHAARAALQEAKSSAVCEEVFTMAAQGYMMAAHLVCGKDNPTQCKIYKTLFYQLMTDAWKKSSDLAANEPKKDITPS